MTPHFSDAELTCKCGCGRLPPQDFQDKLERLRVRFGRSLHLSSAARCPDYNTLKSSTGRTGPHTKRAADILIFGADAFQLVDLAYSVGFTGIGFMQKGPHKDRFVHLDDLEDEPGQPRPTIWSY